MSEQGIRGATCALHPSVPAEAICDRCGGYMCLACSDGNRRRVCPICEAKTGAAPFPLRRDAWTVDALVGIAWQGFVRNMGMLILGFVVLGGSFFAVVMVGEIPLMMLGLRPERAFPVIAGAELAGLAVLCLFVPGFIDMALDAVDGRPVRFGTLFWNMGKIWKFFLFGLLSMLLLLVPTAAFELGIVMAVRFGANGNVLGAVGAGLGSLVALVGLIWAELPLYFGPFELVLDDDCGPVEVFRRVYTLGRGKRWATLGVGFVSYLAAMVVGLVTCDIGLVFSMPFVAVLFAGLFLTFRSDSGLPPPARRGNRARDDIAPEAPGPLLARPVDPPVP